MWRGVGVERDAAGIAEARRALAAIPEGDRPGGRQPPARGPPRGRGGRAAHREPGRPLPPRPPPPRPRPGAPHRLGRRLPVPRPADPRHPPAPRPGQGGRMTTDRTRLRPPRRGRAPRRAARARLGGARGARRARRDPRPPLPEGRGHRVRRRDRRLVPARPPGRGGHRGRADRLPRRLLHGRGRRRAQVAGPDRRAARPRRGLPPGRVRRHLHRARRLGPDDGRAARQARRPAHLHELGRGPEGLRRRARRGRLHLGQRREGVPLGAVGGRRRLLLPRRAPGPQHGLPPRHGARRAPRLEPAAGGPRRPGRGRPRRLAGRSSGRASATSTPRSPRARSPRRAPPTPGSA